MLQALRYYKALQAWPELADGERSLLEVRPGHPGLEAALPRPITALTPVRLAVQPSPMLRTLRGRPEQIPLPDASFDLVLCTGTFEQLVPQLRAQVLAELIRVARSRVVIICTNGHLARLGEQQLASTCKALGHGAAPEAALQAPEPGEMFQLLLGTGLRFELLPNEGFLQHFGGELLELFFPAGAQAMRRLGKRVPGAPPFLANEWDVPYSFTFAVDKSPRAATGAVDNIRPRSPTPGRDAVALYSVYHRRLPTAHLGQVQPIYVGECREQARPGELTDLPQAVPPLENRRWSELSAIYRLWQDGPRSDVIGLCHYRRLFDFRSGATATRETTIHWRQLDTVAANLQPPANLQEMVDDDTIVLPPPMALAMAQTVWAQYGEFHSSGDYCELLNALGRRQPDLLPFAAAHFTRTSLYANNLFILSWRRFDELCRLWFGVLTEVESRLPGGRRDSYQARDISFLAERLFDLWVHYRAEQGTRIVHQPLFFVDFSD